MSPAFVILLAPLALWLALLGTAIWCMHRGHWRCAGLAIVAMASVVSWNLNRL